MIDLAVGAAENDGTGAVWILFLNSDGTVKAHQKIGSQELEPYIGGPTTNWSMATVLARPLADLGPNPSGGRYLAVGAPGDDDGGDADPNDPISDLGAIYILSFYSDGTLSSYRKFSDIFYDDGYQLGTALAYLGDLDGDGSTHLAVGAVGDNNHRGAVLILDF